MQQQQQQQEPVACEFFRPDGKGGIYTVKPMDAVHKKQADAVIDHLEAIKNVPPFEILRMRLTLALTQANPEATDDQIAYQVAFIRITSPACNLCVKKGGGVILVRCTRCWLVWYCSKRCQRLDWTKGGHRRWCCGGDQATAHKTTTTHDPFVVHMMPSADKKATMVNRPDRIFLGLEHVCKALDGQLWLAGNTCLVCSPNRDSPDNLEARLCSKCIYGRFCKHCEPQHYDQHVQQCDGGYLARFGDLRKAAQL
jgi:hypothetical protein